ncbi:hypothetical protein M8I34_17870 [Streptomyces sp. MCA2]|uniref:hypothetical protein n=1 Tax=Streptomyces sp. MCA2 TaxID=2944805 RepID=UPI00202155DC|nr:hypothetical protein [Streptomyces sp. MCA2]MCL7493251.1 hypothetical protein [Streptomyces sp. MCA2]
MLGHSNAASPAMVTHQNNVNDAELHLWHLTSGRLQTLPLLYRCNALTLSSTGQLTIGGPDGLHGIRLDLDRLWD